jgi:hypothetical protein
MVPPATEGWDEANGYLGIAIGVLITVILVLITIILTILYKNLQQGRHGAPKMGQNNTEVHYVYFYIISLFFSFNLKSSKTAKHESCRNASLASITPWIHWASR